MIYIALDLAYSDETTVIIVNTQDAKNRFTFKAIDAKTELSVMLDTAAKICEKYNVPAEHVSVPRHPGIELELRRMLPTLEQLIKRQKVEYENN